MENDLLGVLFVAFSSLLGVLLGPFWAYLGPFGTSESREIKPKSLDVKVPIRSKHALLTCVSTLGLLSTSGQRHRQFGIMGSSKVG